MRSDLVPLTSDLPATAAGGIATQPAGVRGVGDVKRSGPWIVPAEAAHRAHRWDVLRRHQGPPPAPVGEAGAPGQTHRGLALPGGQGVLRDGAVACRVSAAWKDVPA